MLKLLMLLLVIVALPAQALAQDCEPKVCETLERTYQTHCASSLPNPGSQSDMWSARVRAFPAKHESLLSRRAQAQACVACGKMYAKWERDCARRAEQVTKAWGELLQESAKDTTQFKNAVASYERRGLFDQAERYVASEITVLERLVKNTHASVDTSALKARITRLEKQRIKLGAEHEKKIAATRCPKRGKRAKRHEAAVQRFLGQDLDYAKELRVLRTNGKPTRRYDRGQRTTYELRPLTACVRSVAKPTRCHVYEMSVRRERPDGGKWSSWNQVLMGATREMSCKKLR